MKDMYNNIIFPLIPHTFLWVAYVAWILLHLLRFRIFFQKDKMLKMQNQFMRFSEQNKGDDTQKRNNSYVLSTGFIGYS